MRFPRLLAAAGLALSSLILVPGTAYACSCAQLTTVDQVDAADVVVRGTVVARRPPPPTRLRSSMDPVTYTVAVAEVYQGRAGSTVEVLSASSGASCGLEGVDLGRSYVVFATAGPRPDHDDELWANLCGGTAPATPSLVHDVEAAVAAAGSAPPPTPQPPTSEGPAVWPWLAGLAGLGLAAALLAARRRTG